MDLSLCTAGARGREGNRTKHPGMLTKHRSRLPFCDLCDLSKWIRSISRQFQAISSGL